MKKKWSVMACLGMLLILSACRRSGLETETTSSQSETETWESTEDVESTETEAETQICPMGPVYKEWESLSETDRIYKAGEIDENVNYFDSIQAMEDRVLITYMKYAGMNETGNEMWDYTMRTYSPTEDILSEGITLTTYDASFVQDPVMGDGFFYLLTPTGEYEVYSWDLKLLETIPLPGLNGYQALADGKNNCIYYIDLEGMLHILDGYGTAHQEQTVTFPFLEPELAGIFDDGNILIINGVDADSYQFFRYYYDAGTLLMAGFDAGRREGIYEAEGWHNMQVLGDITRILFQKNSESPLYQVIQYGETLYLPTSSFALEENLVFYGLQDENEMNMALVDLSTGNKIAEAQMTLNGEYLDLTGAYLSSLDLFVFSGYEAGDGYCGLYLWDLQDSYIQPEAQMKPLEEGSEEKFEGSEALMAHVEALEDKYGVDLHIGTECIRDYPDYDVQVVTDEALIEQALIQLDEAFSNYPDHFMEQLAFGDIEEMTVYLAGALTPANTQSISDAAAFVTESDHEMMMVLNIYYEDILESTICHETSHWIDRKLAYITTMEGNGSLEEGVWNSFNPAGFSYDFSYVDGPAYFSDIYTRMDPATEENGVYFIDAYSKTFPTEDRARIMEYAICDPQGVQYSHILDKLAYYAACIRGYFNTEGWPEVTTWELLLQGS